MIECKKTRGLIIEMLKEINAFLQSISNWLTAASLIISFLTLVSVLRFNHRMRKAFDKKDFLKEKNHILKLIDGFSASLLDGIYDEKILDSIDLLLSRIAESFSFFGIRVRFYLWLTSFCINHSYKKEASNGKTDSRHKLSLKLQKIRIQIGKE